MKNMAKRYNTQDVIAVTCAIFREAGNKIARDSGTSSKDRIVAHFNNTTPVVITDADREQGNTVFMYVQQRTTINALTGAKVSEFVKDVVELTEKPTVSERDFGRIVWLPKLYADMVARDEVKQDLAHYALTSTYIGRVKDKIEINFTPLTVNYARDYNCYRHLGHDGNGNLIGFLNKEQLTGSIKGRIKKQEVSRYHGNAKVTYLNYVQGV